MLLVEIKDFNWLIDNKPFFDQPVENKQESFGKFIKMSRKDDHTTGRLLDISYHQYYRYVKIRIFHNKFILHKT